MCYYFLTALPSALETAKKQLANKYVYLTIVVSEIIEVIAVALVKPFYGPLNIDKMLKIIYTYQPQT